MKKLKKDAIYLGAPLFLSKSPSKDFKYLEEKLESKLTGWRSHCLSWAGRCTLINFVTQAIPNYTFSTFNVPAKNCTKLDALSRRFWWKPKEGIADSLRGLHGISCVNLKNREVLALKRQKR